MKGEETLPYLMLRGRYLVDYIAEAEAGNTDGSGVHVALNPFIHGAAAGPTGV